MKNEIKELRNALKKQLENITLKDDEYIKLDLDNNVLEQIIFDTDNDGKRTFALDFNLLKKLDLTDISFDNVDIHYFDFSGSYGVKINPQTIWNKDLSYTNLKDAKIIGSFDNCDITCTEFTGAYLSELDIIIE